MTSNVNDTDVMGLCLDIMSVTGLPIEQVKNMVETVMTDPVAGFSLLARHGIVFTTGEYSELRTLNLQGKGKEASQLILKKLKLLYSRKPV